jgi:hypothetical protein
MAAGHEIEMQPRYCQRQFAVFTALAASELRAKYCIRRGDAFVSVCVSHKGPQ